MASQDRGHSYQVPLCGNEEAVWFCGLSTVLLESHQPPLILGDEGGHHGLLADHCASGTQNGPPHL